MEFYTFLTRVCGVRTYWSGVVKFEIDGVQKTIDLSEKRAPVFVVHTADRERVYFFDRHTFKLLYLKRTSNGGYIWDDGDDYDSCAFLDYQSDITEFTPLYYKC